MSTSTPLTRELLERASGEHPIISIVLDLNPTEFATAPARRTQINSLLDAVHTLEEADTSLDHDARKQARADRTRLSEYLTSESLPVSGAAALAVYVSSGDELFETYRLADPCTPAAHFGRHPHLETLAIAPLPERWCAAIVSVDDVTIHLGTGRQNTERITGGDWVRGHPESDGNDHYARDEDINEHLIQVARVLSEEHHAGRYDVLLLGGPVEARTKLEHHLTHEIQGVLASRLDVDPSAVSDNEVAAKVDAILAQRREAARNDTLAHFAEKVAAGDRQAGGRRAVAGIDDVLTALTEQRVATLLLTADFHAKGTRCPACGLQSYNTQPECPVDGTATAPVADLREPVIAAAVRQHASVLVFSEPDPVLAENGVGALLRY